MPSSRKRGPGSPDFRVIHFPTQPHTIAHGLIVYPSYGTGEKNYGTNMRKFKKFKKRKKGVDSVTVLQYNAGVTVLRNNVTFVTQTPSHCFANKLPGGEQPWTTNKS